jgi:hypothetical protein
MKYLVLPLAILATARLATAGMIISEEVEQSKGPMPGKTQMTITASGDKMRVDVGKDLSSIVDSKTGTVTSLLHAQKMAMQLPEGALTAMKQKTAGPKAKPDLKPTGKKETINGFKCEEYKGTLDKMKVTFWFTKEVANQQEILAQLSQLSGGADPLTATLNSGGDFPGFPIRTCIEIPQMGKSTMTIISIKNEDVPDSAFEVPEGYKAMSIPKMSNPGGGAPAVPVDSTGK